MTRTQAKRFREMITRAAAKLTNAEALTSISLFEPWSGEKDYSIGDRVRDGGNLYIAVTTLYPPIPHGVRA